jgi:hypothetical protein
MEGKSPQNTAAGFGEEDDDTMASAVGRCIYYVEPTAALHGPFLNLWYRSSRDALTLLHFHAAMTAKGSGSRNQVDLDGRA